MYAVGQDYASSCCNAAVTSSSTKSTSSQEKSSSSVCVAAIDGRFSDDNYNTKCHSNRLALAMLLPAAEREDHVCLLRLERLEVAALVAVVAAFAAGDNTSTITSGFVVA